MVLNSITVGAVVAPTVIETYFSHVSLASNPFRLLSINMCFLKDI